MILNLSDKPDEVVQVPQVVACSTFSPCGIPLSLFLAGNAQVFSTYPGFPSLAVFMDTLYISGYLSV